MGKVQKASNSVNCEVLYGSLTLIHTGFMIRIARTGQNCLPFETLLYKERRVASVCLPVQHSILPTEHIYVFRMVCVMDTLCVSVTKEVRIYMLFIFQA
jgi:hypothetical protein